MSKRRRLALIFSAFVGIASAMLPLHVDAQKTERSKALATKLMCMCGCGQILRECNHINCPSSAPMLKELDQHVASGEADNLIVQDFIPGVAFALGLGIVLVIIRMWRQRDVNRLVSASAAPMPAATPASEVRSVRLERARQQADKEHED